MPLTPNQFARREGPATHLRPDALRVAWQFDDLITADSHAMHVRFVCSLQIADTEADRRMFEEVFLSAQPVATANDVQLHFAPHLRSAAANAAREQPAERWLASGSVEMQSALVGAAKPVAFASGLEVLPPFDVELSSPSLERSRLESVQRARIEERVAGQVQHLQRAAELLKEFHALREQMPQLSPGQILQHMNPVDRGSTLQSLLLASAKQAAAPLLWAVAGPHLVRIDLSPSQPKVDLVSVRSDAGPLRSVQPATIRGRRTLLIGARSAVLIVPPDSPAETEVFFDPTVQSQLGFNRAVVRGEELWASHGEAGVVGWHLHKPAEPFVRYQPSPGGAVSEQTQDDVPSPPSGPAVSVGASPSLMTAVGRGARLAGPRNLQVLDSQHLVYSVGQELFIAGPDGPRALPAESPSEIVAILPDERTMLVVHADSTIAVLSRQTRLIADRQRRSGRVCAAATLPWLGGVRILLVDNDGPIDCVGFDDPLITQYVSNHRAPRVVTASAEFVAALSSDRQRVIIWPSYQGREPQSEIHVTGLARHRVADLEFG